MMRLPRIPSIVTQAANRIIPRFPVEAEPADDINYWSYLGTPVYAPLELLRDGIVDLRIDTALITVNQPKNIVKTQIQGRNGTVKEYISNDDFYISISGLIVSPYPNQYPREDVERLIELCTLGKAIEVASEFLQHFGINSIVVENFRISQKMGSRNEVPFDIQAISDEAEEVALNPKNNL